MSAHTTVSMFAAGAALLAFWVNVRFPGFGPSRVSRAIVAAGVAVALQTPSLWLIASTRASLGAPAALLLVALPSLTLLFWTAACLLRSLAAAGATQGR